MQHQIILDAELPTFSNRSTNESVQSWFEGTKLPKLDKPCEFLRKNNFKHYRIKILKNGQTLLSVYDKAGKHFYAKQRNLSLTYIILVRNFYGHLK